MRRPLIPRKKLKDYESEATWKGECLITPRSDGHQTSRHVYQLRHGNLARGIFVCHTCDNPHCIRDEHHFTGTAADNMQDAKIKGRTKKSPEECQRISQRRLGMKFSDSHKKNISDALRGRHLSDECKKKISERQKGRKKSPLELQHIKEAAIQRVRVR